MRSAIGFVIVLALCALLALLFVGTVDAIQAPAREACEAAGGTFTPRGGLCYAPGTFLEVSE